jgi:molybdopterin-guanine dinucleotide biosynthesis protein A
MIFQHDKHHRNNEHINHYNQDCLGIVLAGGLSSRMGQDKAQLPRDNATMLDFSKQLLISAGIKHVVTSGDKHGVNDLVVNAGPMGGIYSVLKQYKPKAILVLPVDLPLMTSQTLSQLKQAGELSKKACYYQAQQQIHFLPLYLPITAFVELFLAKSFQEFTEKKTTKGPAIRSLLQQVPYQVLTSPKEQVLFNSNTPEQWQQAQSVFAQSKRNKHLNASSNANPLNI